MHQGSHSPVPAAKLPHTAITPFPQCVLPAPQRTLKPLNPQTPHNMYMQQTAAIGGDYWVHWPGEPNEEDDMNAVLANFNSVL